MDIGIFTLLIVIVGFLVIKSILKFSLRLFALGVLIITAVFTIWICAEKPNMHKPLSLNTIEYLFKINKDGSVTTTKQITTTGVYKK